MQLTRSNNEKTIISFNHKKVTKNLAIIILSLILCGCMLISYSNSNVSTYKELFLSGNNLKAKEYYENKAQKAINKKLSFKDNVASFLEEQLNTTLEKYNNGEINDEATISLINEIKSYNLLSAETLNNGIYKIQSSKALKDINTLLKESKDFENILKTIGEVENQYPNLEGLSAAKNQAVAGLKAAVLAEGSSLLDNGKTNEAIAKLEEKASYFTGDSEYEALLNSYKAKREEELKQIAEQERIEKEKQRILEEEKKKAAAVMAVNTSLHRGDFGTSQEFINATNLSSSKPYLIYVNLENQTTEVFKGSRGNWNLVYSFISSTGKAGTPTPRGTYKVTGRGSWFFSRQFQQGGKYYVQFWGDYLFHSLPMDINKNVVDSTLGTPASHGCVRLNIEDSKWLYDNIPNGTTVFIK